MRALLLSNLLFIFLFIFEYICMLVALFSAGVQVEETWFTLCNLNILIRIYSFVVDTNGI